MSKWKLALIGISFGLSYFFMFLFSQGWIIATIILLFSVILLFIKQGGTILDMINSFKKSSLESKKFEEEEKNEMLEVSKSLNRKIALGLSGGVDSAVSAFLLKQQGYEVIAFFMKNWSPKQNLETNFSLNDNECEIERDYDDAKKVANFLGIKLYLIDFVNDYWEDVFKPFINNLKLGKTPNPDVLCNKNIKFGKFIDYIKINFPEIHFFSTGHYANVTIKNNETYLVEARDKFKDQTYFLSEISKEILSKLKFPLANLTKEEVRKIAVENNIPVFNKPDSMGICFIGERNFEKFIENWIPQKEGNVVDVEIGEIIGHHKNVSYYTIGQRKKLGITKNDKAYYVTKKDFENNVLYVSSKEYVGNYKNKIIVTNFNLLVSNLKFDKWIKNCEAKIRHGEKKYKVNTVVIDWDNLKLEVITKKEKFEFVAPGQELVLYHKNVVLGGGNIVSSEK